MIDKLRTEHHLEFLSLKGGSRGSSESTLVKMPHCWKSHVTAQINNAIQTENYVEQEIYTEKIWLTIKYTQKTKYTDFLIPHF